MYEYNLYLKKIMRSFIHQITDGEDKLFSFNLFTLSMTIFFFENSKINYEKQQNNVYFTKVPAFYTK